MQIVNRLCISNARHLLCTTDMALDWIAAERAIRVPIRFLRPLSAIAGCDLADFPEPEALDPKIQKYDKFCRKSLDACLTGSGKSVVYASFIPRRG